MSDELPEIAKRPRGLLILAVGLALVLAAAAFLAWRLVAHLSLGWLAIAPVWAWLPISIALILQGRGHLIAQERRHQAFLAHRQVDQFKVTRRDVLTGLPNRQAFTETLSSQFAGGGRFAVMVIDLDGFDVINANLGDAAGDELLSGFSKRVQAEVGRDQSARLDGDSFGLILTGMENLRSLPQTADRILSRLSQPQAASGELLDVTVSAGIAIAGEHGHTAETLLRAARLTLVQAKQMGGARWNICGHDVAEMVLSRQTTRRDMVRGIEAGQFVPYYQPIVRLPHASGGGADIAKFEILARWNHPELGVLAPSQFISLADDLGLSGLISMALLRQVAKETEDWPTWCRFAINVSAGQVRELIGLLSTQPGEWQRRLDLSRLDVEISESALIRDRALARELIDVLHDNGARAVLDDFGSGTSNFFHLQDMPFDSIKIGKPFVQNLLESSRVEACVISMLSLGEGLGVEIVADGVERQEVADRLADLGCHFAQGFLYAHPMPAQSAAKLLGVVARVEA
jgi:diguanylate cyclase (GGDEF)-like protein